MINLTHIVKSSYIKMEAISNWFVKITNKRSIVLRFLTHCKKLWNDAVLETSSGRVHMNYHFCVDIFIHLRVHMCLCMYLCVCVSVCVHMCIRIHIISLLYCDKWQNYNFMSFLHPSMYIQLCNVIWQKYQLYFKLQAIYLKTTQNVTH